MNTSLNHGARLLRIPTWTSVAVLAAFGLCVVQSCASSRRGHSETERSSSGVYGKLEGVVVDGANEMSPSPADLRIARGSGRPTLSVGMAIEKADTIATSPNARALLTLVESYEVTLDTGTIIVIENPSIFVRLGQLFIRKLTGKSDTMTVHTNHVTILDKGTSFFVRVLSEDSVQVFVADGTVTVLPNAGEDWPQQTYRAGQGGTFIGRRSPLRMSVPPLAMNTELTWVHRVDSLIRVRVPLLNSLTESEARALLDRIGLRVLLVQRKVTGNAQAGRVIGQTPLPNSYAPPGSGVTLVVEDGEASNPPEKKVPAGLPPPSAPSTPSRPVIEQKAPDSAELPRVCIVPNILKRSETTAVKLIKEAGYMPRRQGMRGDFVYRQSPTAKKTAACGQLIVFVMGSREK